MASNSIMQDIRTLLSQGKSSREVIQLGYAPGTVYKVQRQLRGTEQPDRNAPAKVRCQASEMSNQLKQEGWTDADWQAFFEAAGPDPMGALRADLNQAQDCIKELERQVINLRDRVLALEAVANPAGNIKDCDHSLPVARQSNNAGMGNSRPNAWDVALARDKSKSTHRNG